jgi:hypothetical protein
MTLSTVGSNILPTTALFSTSTFDLGVLDEPVDDHINVG